VGRGNNRVTEQLDPTAHAEIVAIRGACRTLGRFDLRDCDLYTSCEPCPMCLAAIYWARLDHVFYASTRRDAAETGFDDQFIYEQLLLEIAARSLPMNQLLRKTCTGIVPRVGGKAGQDSILTIRGALPKCHPERSEEPRNQYWRTTDWNHRGVPRFRSG
jgi:tRNA(Arg) A34 adenosine deaminase TadA